MPNVVTIVVGRKMDARFILIFLLQYYLIVYVVGMDSVYLAMERVNITYYNPEYGFLNATSSRPGRWDHKYYINGYLRTLKTLDNNVKVDFWFYEFRSNEYRRGFVEMHFAYCDMVLKDPFFGAAIRANVPDCPLPPGSYHLRNMSVPDLPVLATFPFRKGRIYARWSRASTHIFEACVDVEIKAKPKDRTKANTKAKQMTLA